MIYPVSVLSLFLVKFIGHLIKIWLNKYLDSFKLPNVYSYNL